MTEGQKARKLKKIDLLKKELRYEKAKFGGYHDGRGFRYTIAELYFQVGDNKKTNRYLNWFFKTFPDDSTYPHFKLGASNSFFLTSKYQKAIDFLIDINRENTYILHTITETKIEVQNKDEPYDFNKLEWAQEKKESLLEFTKPDFLNWVSNLISSEEYLMWYTKYISILKLIKDLDVSQERTELLNASYTCLSDWKVEMKNYPKH